MCTPPPVFFSTTRRKFRSTLSEYLRFWGSCSGHIDVHVDRHGCGGPCSCRDCFCSAGKTEPATQRGGGRSDQKGNVGISLKFSSKFAVTDTSERITGGNMGEWRWVAAPVCNRAERTNAPGGIEFKVDRRKKRQSNLLTAKLQMVAHFVFDQPPLPIWFVVRTFSFYCIDSIFLSKEFALGRGRICWA